ncbi:hypothetical protein G3N55_06490 [Dissulfurirhabdus thermomarina]|uniref:MipA/OmpV family protein n=1 Tax=Dissulfurirhabdus thermomarina TaxID=1765737 RepID=A0A6N9TMX9_DISTH|nr:TorF family putative porin [Dissulfurirhabdus thermomarina]NDY42489.1 hypothetical protein [Dissulfurirhabdus thermomarina]NMX22874.1 hypothetical protein [Dissulfurirhabdus thermomarina]
MKRHDGARCKMVVRVLVLAVGALCGFTMAASALAAEEKPAAALSVDVLSQYIFRGFALSEDSVVIQPAISVDYMGFEAELWGNVDTNRDSAAAGNHLNSWTETEATLAYSHAFGPVEVTGGFIYYAFDDPAIDDAEEFFAKLALPDLPLAPTLTAYREVAHKPSWYIALEVSQDFALAHGMSLELGARAAYLISNDRDEFPEIDDHGVIHGKFNDFDDGRVSAALSIPVTEYVTVRPEVFWSFPLSSDAESLIRDAGLSVTTDSASYVYGGIGAVMRF